MSQSRLSFPATFSAYAHASGELRRLLHDGGVASKPCYSSELVFEELVSNVIRHGCSEHMECALDVTISVDDSAIVMTLADDGPPFDPRSHPVHALPERLEDARAGGIGLLLVRKACSQIDYERTTDHRNRVTVHIPLDETALRSGH